MRMHTHVINHQTLKKFTHNSQISQLGSATWILAALPTSFHSDRHPSTNHSSSSSFSKPADSQSVSHCEMDDAKSTSKRDLFQFYSEREKTRIDITFGFIIKLNFCRTRVKN
ncbi:hypothetical protein WH47_05247 [Habropoda laboriosa]|uniref:Uncharacterized protein n=1 Tax=Habropoda laboriosa TaxID=597456 RepID=A0A0L7RKI1_9HYME|nr:hypothetical protein WH47_05247 [Habropoda laboriosa]